MVGWEGELVEGGEEGGWGLRPSVVVWDESGSRSSCWSGSQGLVSENPSLHLHMT